MSIAQINVEIDQAQVREYINEKLDGSLQRTLFTWDINKMAELTCMSKSFLEQEILCDPRMRILERRKEKGKRFWFYEQSLEVIREIMDDW